MKKCLEAYPTHFQDMVHSKLSKLKSSPQQQQLITPQHQPTSKLSTVEEFKNRITQIQSRYQFAQKDIQARYNSNQR